MEAGVVRLDTKCSAAVTILAKFKNAVFPFVLRNYRPGSLCGAEVGQDSNRAGSRGK